MVKTLRVQPEALQVMTAQLQALSITQGNITCPLSENSRTVHEEKWLKYSCN